MNKLLAVLVFAGCIIPATHAVHMYNYKFDVSLSGDNNVSDGDPDGSGMAEIIIDADGEMIWWDIMTSDIAPITMDHIHQGMEGATGPVVFDFGGALSGMSSIDMSLAEMIIENPTDYYVNLHNAEFPSGAIRGQLGQPMEVPKHVPDAVGAATAFFALGGLVLGQRARRKRS